MPLSIDPNRDSRPTSSNDRVRTSSGKELRPLEPETTQSSNYTGSITKSSPKSPFPGVVPYQDVTTAFAVDVSYSTRAGILDQELYAVERLAQELSASSRDRARVLPWESIAVRPRSLHTTDSLRSSGGTDPTVLTSDSLCKSVLQNCSLWFLLTDGEIDTNIVRDFALGIGEEGLHGKACVTILFGYRPSRPASCNISVGQAIFAVAPDCAFLFQDVASGEVFVFQCKGCFRKLLPHSTMEIVLDNKTDWRELPQISYNEIANIAVPKPRKVGMNTALLTSGRIVNLEDLYHNRLGQEVAAEIFDNDDDLKSILLTAQSRGKSREIEHWICKQRMSQKAHEYFDRPDIDNNASKILKALIIALKGQTRNTYLEKACRRDLREAHQVNWASFISSITIAEEQMVQRNTVVNHALARVMLGRDTPSSPTMMSPISSGPIAHLSKSQNPFHPASHVSQSSSYSPPPLPKISPAQLHPWQSPNRQLAGTGWGDHQPYGPSSAYQGEYGPLAGYQVSDTYQARDQWAARSIPPMPQQAQPQAFPGNLELSDLLYMRGYKLGSGPAAAQPFCGFCTLCEDESSPLTLLLKVKPAEEETEGDFPIPDSHAEIRFPLAMGNFVETDIISSFLCCEKCAYFVRELGTSPEDEKVTGAIPLVPLSNEMNRDSTLKEIDVALEKRFHVTILDQIFLSIMYKKLDDVMAENLPEHQLLIKALRWGCRNFLSQISLPNTLSTSFDPSEDVVFTPLSSTMSAVLPSIDTSGPNNLIYYPIDGFIILLKGTVELGVMTASDDLVKRAVFQRFLFHLAEQQSMLREDFGIDEATKELGRVLSGEIGGLSPGRFCAEVETLEGTYLLETDAWNAFRRLKDVFRYVERDCGPAIRTFLQLMVDMPWKDGPAEEMFDLAKVTYGDSKLFTAPWELRDNDCVNLLRRLPL
ncbi:MAG: hypothetical protein Q9227_000414 [Pyrenula ochraceoflavens]